MHVALILPSFAGGGAERVILDIAAGLIERDVRVDLVVVKDEGPLRNEVPAGARKVVLGASRVALSGSKLLKYLKKERPSVAVSALSHMNVVTVLTSRLLKPRMPVVLTHHNQLSMAASHAANYRERLMPRIVRVVFRLADKVVAPSKGVEEDLVVGTGLPADKVQVIYYPVRFGRLLTAAEGPVEHPWLADKTTPVAMAMGRLHDQKDYPTLIRAFALLPEEWRLIIFGEGERRPQLESLAEELGVKERLDLPGYCSNPFPCLRKADVFVVSSKWEGLPVGLIESLAFPARIVSTDCPSGPKEILAEGRWGRLVPVEDPKSLASAILEAAAEPPPDRTEALHPYQIDTVAGRYLDLLRLVDPTTEPAPSPNP